MGTGGDWSPNFWFGDQQCIGPPPNFLAVVFKKQEISQQVLLLLSETQSFHIIIPHSANILVDIQPATDLALDMLVVCSDIHVLGSPLMSAEATRMQDLASEFSKIFRGNTPGPPQREGATHSRTHPQPGLWPGAGRKRPGVWTQTLVPLNFSAVVAPLTTFNVKRSKVNLLVTDVLNSQHAGTGATWRMNAKILSTYSGRMHIVSPRAQLVRSA